MQETPVRFLGLCWRRDRLPTPVFLGFPVAQLVKNPPAVRETWVRSLGWEDPLEKGKATHSNSLAWRLSTGSQRVGHHWATFTCTRTSLECSRMLTSSICWGFSSVSVSRSVASDSFRPHGLYNPRNSPGETIGVGSLSLLQGIFPTQGSNPGLLHCRRILYQLSHKGSPIYICICIFCHKEKS